MTRLKKTITVSFSAFKFNSVVPSAVRAFILRLRSVREFCLFLCTSGSHFATVFLHVAAVGNRCSIVICVPK